MDLLDGLLPEPGSKSLTSLHYERLFIFAIMWSFGALLELEDRALMEVFLKNKRPRLDLPKVHPVRNENIFEFLVDEQGNYCNFILSIYLLVHFQHSH